MPGKVETIDNMEYILGYTLPIYFLFRLLTAVYTNTSIPWIVVVYLIKISIHAIRQRGTASIHKMPNCSILEILSLSRSFFFLNFKMKRLFFLAR